MGSICDKKKVIDFKGWEKNKKDGFNPLTYSTDIFKILKSEALQINLEHGAHNIIPIAGQVHI